MQALLLLLVGVFGLIETIVPQAIVRLWTRLTYRDSGDAEAREWLYVAVRIEGAILVLVSLVGLFRVATADGSADEAVDETADEATDVPATDER